MNLMSQIKNSTLAAKLSMGAGSLAIVGLIGFGAAQAATSDTTGSGYGSGTQSVAANTFADAINADDDIFATQVANVSVQAENAIKSASPTRDFDETFVTATDAYTDSLNNAYDVFVAQANAAANTAQNKDQFINKFNNAKATYLNSLDTAKNQFANTLSSLGDSANQAKDVFISGFNSDRDAYSNMLEQAKNDFAATVSNLQ